MKQSDLFTLILVASIGVIGSFFAVQALLGDPKEATVKFTTVVPIESTLVKPDPEIFHSTAINPTVEVFVGECEDINQNGILDEAELDACAKAQEQEVGNIENGEDGGEATQD